MPAATVTLKAISRQASPFACSNFPAPRDCPTITDTAVPMAKVTALNTLEMVEEMLRAGTTFRPQRE